MSSDTNCPHRLCAGGGNSGHECRRARRPVKGLCEIARLVDDGLPSHHLAAYRPIVVADLSPYGRDYRLEAVLFLAGLHA